MRVSPTDKRGRIHTSLITVAVLPIIKTNSIQLKESEYEFRFIRASSKGGQHANKTESGVVVKHKATGIEAKSTKDRSQMVNKETALEILVSRLASLQQINSQKSLDYNRTKQVGSGHRSDKIRTARVVDNTVKCELTGKTKSYREYYKGLITF